jgi:hypothetical protein
LIFCSRFVPEAKQIAVTSEAQPKSRYPPVTVLEGKIEKTERTMEGKCRHVMPKLEEFEGG